MKALKLTAIMLLAGAYATVLAPAAIAQVNQMDAEMNIIPDKTVKTDGGIRISLCLVGIPHTSQRIDGIDLVADTMADEDRNRLALGILQAARRRVSRTEFVSCPGCGRTLFDLQSTVKTVKSATSHLKGLKIAVMGCIVNGPGEMADADYGYVGAGVGRVSLYRGKECVLKNIPSEEAVEHLLALLRADGRIE